MELWEGKTLSASVTAPMTQGIASYSFHKVASGTYTLVVTSEENGRTVRLTMPLRVGV